MPVVKKTSWSIPVFKYSGKMDADINVLCKALGNNTQQCALHTEGAVYMFSLERDPCLCLHLISLLPYQQTGNFPTIFL